jgi:hypothetical protein
MKLRTTGAVGPLNPVHQEQFTRVRILEQRAAGWSLRRIAEDLTDSGTLHVGVRRVIDQEAARIAGGVTRCPAADSGCVQWSGFARLEQIGMPSRSNMTMNTIGFAETLLRSDSLLMARFILIIGDSAVNTCGNN